MVFTGSISFFACMCNPTRLCHYRPLPVSNLITTKKPSSHKFQSFKTFLRCFYSIHSCCYHFNGYTFSPHTKQY